MSGNAVIMVIPPCPEIWFQPELPGLYILHQEMVFLAFSQFFKNIHQPHLVARQNVTFWRVGKNMSAPDASEEDEGQCYTNVKTRYTESL